MKIVTQTVLIIFFVICLTVMLASATFKFGLLNYNFLTKTFQNNDVYNKLSIIIKSSVEAQVGRGGGNKNDVSVLTDLITKENTVDIVDNNILNTLDFMNGKSGNLKIYVPIDKFPSGVLPKNISDLNREMTITEVGSRFNIVGLDNIPLQEISKIGIYTYYILIGSTGFCVVLIVLLALTVDAKKRFIAPVVAFVLSGFIVFLLTQLGNNINSLLKQSLSSTSSLNKIVVVTMIPPVLSEIIKIWIYVGTSLIVFGAALILIKKPSQEV